MLQNNIYRINITVVLIAFFLLLAFYIRSDDDKYNVKKTSEVTQVDTYLFQINRLILPLSNDGVIANVDLGYIGDGRYDGEGILFSGGFMMSGLNGDSIWSNAVATASRIQDYLPGEAGKTSDPRTHLYIINSNDEPFGQSWQEWKDAVDLGAYFYDGDEDGLYNPIDKNGNSVWDSNEDRPDLLGDETVWCVYNDGVLSSSRAYSDQYPMGIEIRQTMWGYADSSYLGNVVFVRYSINNAGTVSDFLDSVYFGTWADVDIGGSDGYTDDLTGCDTLLDAGFTYNDGPDPTYGVNPPCFIIDLIQGPITKTNNSNDIAFNFRGIVIGTDTIYSAVNLPMTSFVHYEKSVGDPDYPQQIRNYLLGNGQYGQPNDPCNLSFGKVFGGINCLEVNPKFMFSGDPVLSYGWINTYPTDQRQISSTGPFKLKKNKQVDIIVAYIAGRGSSALQSINVAKQIARRTNFGFRNNFKYPSPPSPVKPIIKTTDNSIELVWETSKDLSYRKTGAGYHMMFESYEVYMHETDSSAGGYNNKVLIASYDVDNDINNIYLEDPLYYNRTTIYQQGIQLDSSTYADPEKGRISLNISTDPFTGNSLIKGKPYFISIVSTAYNRDEIVKLDILGNYLIPGTSAFGKLVATTSILSDSVSTFGIVPGKDTYTPYKSGIETEHYEGVSDAVVTYNVIDKSKITGDKYEISFVQDTNVTLYSLYYRITDLNTDRVLLDSSKHYNSGNKNDLVGGAVAIIEWIKPGIKSKQFIGQTRWFDLNERKDSVGIFYMGNDVDDSSGLVVSVSPRKSYITKVQDMKAVELRFGQSDKAYRYMKGLYTYSYSGDSGFVDVPFQAWVNDKTLGLEYQLAVGFTESALKLDTLANPDGIYDPGFNVYGSKEYIIIFNSSYDPTGNQYEYTGNSQKWANISKGYNLPNNDPRYNDSLKTIAESPWFNALYVAGLQRTGNPNTPMTGTYVIKPSLPLTPNDKYRFTVNTDLTTSEEKDLFNKINVFPNPLFSYNPVTGYTGEPADDPYVTFSYLPNELTIRIYSLSGILIRTLTKNDTSPFMKWDLQNEYGNRVASGMYLAIISNPKFGEKVLKFAVIIPRK